MRLLPGAMMLGLGALLVLAPGLLDNVGVAFGLVAAAVAVTWVAARSKRSPARGESL